MIGKNDFEADEVNQAFLKAKPLASLLEIIEVCSIDFKCNFDHSCPTNRNI
jgi:hypothetical protein